MEILFETPKLSNIKEQNLNLDNFMIPRNYMNIKKYQKDSLFFEENSRI